MSYESKTISRQVTNAPPSWVAGLTATNTLYAVGGNPSAMAAQLVWPGPYTDENLNFWGGAGTEANVHNGYNGAIHLEDVGGAFGTMFFGAAGENYFGNTRARWDLSSASPAWWIDEQPTYCTSEAQAAAADADVYYDPVAAAALPSVQKIPLDDGTWIAAWQAAGSPFPLGHRGWIFRRKATTFSHGGGKPWSFRYDGLAYIPPSMTGTGAGALLVNPINHYGPFTAWQPAYMAYASGGDSNWAAEAWPSGVRKYRVWAQNVKTKAWTTIAAPIPEHTPNNNVIFKSYPAIDRLNKRAYWTGMDTSFLYYYHDLSAGIAGATASAVLRCASVPSGSWATSVHGNSVFAATKTGRRLLYMIETVASNTLLLLDIDNNNLIRLSLGSRGLTGISYAECFVSLTHDPVNDRIIMTSRTDPNNGPVTMRTHQFAIPADPTSAANYSVSEAALADPTGAIDGNYVWAHGDRCKFHPELGCILYPQRSGKMLAYRPA